MADSTITDLTQSTGPEPNRRWTWQHVEDALRGLEFGAVTLLVQDGVVVQVERTERKRYQRSPRTRELSVRCRPAPREACHHSLRC